MVIAAHKFFTFDLERERIARHETGHAVVAVVEGLGLHHARLTPETEVITNVMLGRIPWLCVAARVKFYLAGFAADLRFLPAAFAIRDAIRRQSNLEVEPPLRPCCHSDGHKFR